MRQIPTWVWILGGVVLLAALSTGGVVVSNYLTAAWMSSSNAQQWAPFLQSIEDQIGLPPGLLARIAYQESRFRDDIISGIKASSAGALGMMQLMPQYFATVRRPIPFSEEDTQDQIVEAATLLANLFNHFQDWTLAVAAYNAGQHAIDKVLANTAPLRPETANYLTQVSADLPAIVNPTLTA